MRTISEYFDQDSQDLNPKQPLTPAMFHKEAESEVPKPKVSPVKVALGIVAVFVLIVLMQFTPWVQDAQERNRAQTQGARQ